MNRRQFGAALAGLGAGALVFPGRMLASLAPTRIRVDGERLMGQLRALAEYGKNPQGGVSRVAYSEADLRGRAYVAGLMREAGLQVETDLAGNLVGRRVGTEPGLWPLAFGSHIDSVPNGGNYDGPVGSLAAIEAARTLHEQGIRTRHPLEVLIFQNEEGGKTGSRILDGEFEPKELELRTASGRTIGEGIRLLGGDPDRWAEARRAPGEIAAFLELHIEQGGVLESAGVQVGVVEGIVGIERWVATVEGFANHAGTTPMDQRQDALLAAARYVELVNRVARETPGRHVATVGKLEVAPGAPNVIPGRVTASLEIRDLDGETIGRLFREIEAGARRIAAETATRIHLEHTYSSRAARMDPRVQEAVAASAAALDLSHRSMPSGAGHDAQSMARLGPAGMIFVPSVGGISHSPREFTHPHDVINGANVLLGTLLRLDGPQG